MSGENPKPVTTRAVVLVDVAVADGAVVTSPVSGPGPFRTVCSARPGRSCRADDRAGPGHHRQGHVIRIRLGPSKSRDLKAAWIGSP